MRVHHVKKARKDHPGGIKRGQEYWWWKPHIRASKHYSKTRPRPSRLTNSDKLSRLLAAQESVEDAVAEARGGDTLVDVEAAVEAAAEEWREVAEEYRESAQSIEEGFNHRMQQCDEMEERADRVEEFAQELDSFYWYWTLDEDADDEDQVEDKLDEVDDLGWEYE